MVNAASERPLVLIVERDRTVRELQSHFLGQGGFAVEFPETGELAIARAKLASPVLVITEILIAGMDGLTLCRRLRDDPATQSIPVIVFSILAAQARATEAGARAFVRKPIVEQQFLAAVRSVTGVQSLATAVEPQWASR